MVHGTHDRYTVWSRVEKGTSQFPPTTTHLSGNYNDTQADGRDAASKTLVTGLCGSMELGYGFSAGIQADYINYMEYREQVRKRTHQRPAADRNAVVFDMTDTLHMVWVFT